LDAGRMTGEMPPEAAVALTQAKLDKVCFITSLDKKMGYVVFPGDMTQKDCYPGRG
jgi:hypothetical protein